jgi:hypothetical protein
VNQSNVKEAAHAHKQGQELHYNQEKMLSVREFARAQVGVEEVCMGVRGHGLCTVLKPPMQRQAVRIVLVVVTLLQLGCCVVRS